MDKPKDTRAQLREALDRQALKWVAILDDERTDEDGIALYSMETKERVFKRATEWLKESKRLFPDTAPTEGPGVTSMRAWMKDASPENIREFKKMLGLVSADKKKPATPTPTRDKQAEQARAAEGSALRALVFSGEGLEMTDGD